MNEPQTENPNPFQIQEPIPAALPPKKRLPPPQKPSRKKLFIILGIIAVVLIAGIVVLYLLVIKKPAKPASTPDTSLIEKVETVKHDVPDMVNTETYKSEKLGLQLSYPSSWKITEATDGGTRIESANFSYTTATGSSVSGNFRLYIRQGARTADGGYIGRGYAIVPSEKLIYTKPSPGQRTDTLISSFGYDTPDNFAFFLIAGNFQLSKGDTLGPNYAKETDAYVIAGGYSSDTNKDDLQMNEVPVSYYNTTDAYKQAVTILASIKIY